MTDFLVAAISRWVLVLAAAWFIMVLLPSAFDLHWGYGRVLSGTVIVMLIAQLFAFERQATE